MRYINRLPRREAEHLGDMSVGDAIETVLDKVDRMTHAELLEMFGKYPVIEELVGVLCAVECCCYE